jgi:hypothetical protein
MRDPRNEDEPAPIIDCIDDPIIADPDTEVVTTGQLGNSYRAWLLTQFVYCLLPAI